MAPFWSIIALYYAVRLATEDKKNIGFTRKEARDNRYSEIAITDSDFEEDLAIVTN